MKEIGAVRVPILFFEIFMKASEIKEKILPAVESRGAFLVDVTVSSDNDVEVVIESREGIVSMEDCVAVDKAFHEIWNQDEEDYALTVSSAGLGRPFKVPEQYRKAIGSKVVARLRGGRKTVAELVGADDDTVTLRYPEKDVTETIPLAQVNTIAYYI